MFPTLPPTHLNMMATAFPRAASNSPYTMGQNTTPSPPQSYHPNSTSPQTPPSSNQSPTSYHSHLHVRQLRPQKQPLYTPACLRPTESSRPKDIPGPRAPDTPPSSKQNSFDSGNFGMGMTEAPTSSAQESDLDLLRQGLSRAASEGIDEEYGDVTGPPTIAHWKVRFNILSSSLFYLRSIGSLGYFRSTDRQVQKDVVLQSVDP